MRARALCLAVLLALTVAAPAAAACVPRTSAAAVEDDVMCLVCGVPLALAVDSPQAQRERALIARLAARCETKPQIERALVAEYGPEVLASPQGGGWRVTAWLVPLAIVVLLTAGLGLATGVLRRSPAPRA
jgi:cytochrome c-type biogenesis protein CcmH